MKMIKFYFICILLIYTTAIYGQNEDILCKPCVVDFIKSLNISVTPEVFKVSKCYCDYLVEIVEYTDLLGNNCIDAKRISTNEIVNFCANQMNNFNWTQSDIGATFDVTYVDGTCFSLYCSSNTKNVTCFNGYETNDYIRVEVYEGLPSVFMFNYKTCEIDYTCQSATSVQILGSFDPFPACWISNPTDYTNIYADPIVERSNQCIPSQMTRYNYQTGDYLFPHSSITVNTPFQFLFHTNIINPYGTSYDFYSDNGLFINGLNNNCYYFNPEFLLNIEGTYYIQHSILYADYNRRILREYYPIYVEKSPIPTFTEVLPNPFINITAYDAQIGDIDNDGDMDIIFHKQLARNNNGSFNIENYPSGSDNGNGSLLDINSDGILEYTKGYLDLVDFNNDGIMSILAGNEFESLGGQFSPPECILTEITDNSCIIDNLNDYQSGIYTDFNYDKVYDLILDNRIYTNVQAGYNQIRTLPFSVFGSKAFDMNNDGKTDIINGPYGAPIQIMLNNGNITNVGSPRWRQIHIGDINNDGHLDILNNGVYFKNGDQMTFTFFNNFAELSPVANLFKPIDYDNDGDLDLLVLRNGLPPKLFRNNSTVRNNRPSPPVNTSATVTADSVNFSWSHGGDDLTMFPTYNLYVYNKDTNKPVLLPVADLVSGAQRKLQKGNVEYNIGWKLKNLPPGLYGWKVQAVDQGFLGSLWSAEREFVIEAPICDTEIEMVQGVTCILPKVISTGEILYPCEYTDGAMALPDEVGYKAKIAYTAYTGSDCFSVCQQGTQVSISCVSSCLTCFPKSNPQTFIATQDTSITVAHLMSENIHGCILSFDKTQIKTEIPFKCSFLNGQNTALDSFWVYDLMSGDSCLSFVNFVNNGLCCIPYTICNDNNSCTFGDYYDQDCNCIGSIKSSNKDYSFVTTTGDTIRMTRKKESCDVYVLIMYAHWCKPCQDLYESHRPDNYNVHPNLMVVPIMMEVTDKDLDFLKNYSYDFINDNPFYNIVEGGESEFWDDHCLSSFPTIFIKCPNSDTLAVINNGLNNIRSSIPNAVNNFIENNCTCGGCTTSEFTQSFTICNSDSVTVGSNVYNQTGTYIDTLPSFNGCDSVITTLINVKPNSTNTLNIQICQGEMVTIGNNIYTSPGTYVDTLASFNGCDSIITSTITIKPNTTSTQSIQICQGHSVTIGNNIYTSPGMFIDTLQSFNDCDSIVTTFIEVIPLSSKEQTISICQGSSISVGNGIYDQTGIYRDTLPNQQGCDSVLVTILTVIAPQLVTINGPDQICKGTSVELTVENQGNNHLWSVGLTSQTITVMPDVNTSYMVTVTDQNNCTGTALKTIDVISPKSVGVPLQDTVTFCQKDSIINLSSFIIQNDGGGIWKMNDEPLQNLHINLQSLNIGAYTASYGQYDQEPCPPEDAGFVLMIKDCRIKDCSYILEDDSIFVNKNEASKISLTLNDILPEEYIISIISVNPDVLDDTYLSDDGLYVFTVTGDFEDIVQVVYEICTADCLDCKQASLWIDNEAIKEITRTNIILPNTSGNNTTLRFTKEDILEDSELYIFNRNGDRIFHMKDYNNSWNADGYPGGIYYYVLRYKGVDIKKTLTVIK